ncbi:MAG: DUF2141 domain-containing protein [Ekhidna sp.]|nr:DUF2141 domain-containing protein [Ekhidna sp.]
MQLFYQLLFVTTLFFHDADPSSIRVTIQGIANTSGYIQIGLYNQEELFLKKTFRAKKVSVDQFSIEEYFEAIPEGNYAISIFHDENGNGKLDSNLFRIPKEPYGFSNNPSTTFGPPDFDGASFVHKAKKTTWIKIQLK